MMKRDFSASVIYNGVHGGRFFIEDDKIVYESQKLVLPDNLKHLEIPFDEIRNIKSSQSLILFPKVSIRAKRTYKFIVPNRKGFLNVLNKTKEKATN